MAEMEHQRDSGGKERVPDAPSRDLSSKTPWDKESISKVRPDLISEIKKEMYRVKDALVADGKNDLGSLAVLVKQTGTDIQIPPNVNELDLYEACNLLGEVNERILVPRGEILSVMYIGDKSGVNYGKIREETWTKESYLESVVWTARVNWFVTLSDVFGISFENFAFVDAEKSRKDAYPMYLLVSKQIPCEPNIVHDLLADQLQRTGIGAKEYCELLGENRLLQEEVRHAKDHIFARHVLGANHDRSDKVAIVNALLKPSSTLKMYLDPGKERSFASQTKASGIVEHCARLGGVIAEVQALLDLEKPDHAFCAFLDYIFMNVIAYESRNSISPSDPNARYMIASRFLFSGIADHGIRSNEEIVARVVQGSKHPGVNSLEFLTEIFRMDFWDDEERAKIVAGKIV